MAATFEGLYFFGVHYKILIITAQVLGFAVSKGIGVKVVSEMQPPDRAKNLLKFTALSWLCMLFFGLVPPPYNLVFVFMASLPLGLFYGIILGYLEGRRSTDLLVAILTASFIVGSGFAKSIGSWLMQQMSVSQFMMPFWADTLMYVPMAVCILILHKIPKPSSLDQQMRMPRQAMDVAQRGQFVDKFRPGLVLFIFSYVILTCFRELRDNFSPEILKELGMGAQVTLFTKTEIPIALLILLIMASMRWVQNNSRAFSIIQYLLMLGAVLIMGSTLLYQLGLISPILWLICTGFGAYLAYAMSNSLYFERMIASFRQIGTVGFLITLADFYAYFGSIFVLFYKNYFLPKMSFVGFFINASYLIGILYFIAIFTSKIYFNKKAKGL